MPLKSLAPEKYGETYSSAVLEQWKTCVEAASSTSEKRTNSNTIYTTINAALIAVISYSINAKSILISLAGIAICVLWMQSIKGYKQLSSVKYHIINDIEAFLPLSPFSYEWERLKNDLNYKGLTRIERLLPWLFIAIYVLSILVPVIRIIIPLICTCIGGN